MLFGLNRFHAAPHINSWWQESSVKVCNVPKKDKNNLFTYLIDLLCDWTVEKVVTSRG